MGVVEDIFAKSPSEVCLSDIQKLIDDKREETRTLEYKSPQILKKPSDLSKWVSALLNADGGLIILGLCESDPNKKTQINPKIYPTKIDFVESEHNKESIDQIIFSNLGCSSKPDIRIYPVRDPDDYSRAIYLIAIPQGDNPPYQAQNKKYYRRLNATKYEMPHSEIADFFNKRRRPKLNIACRVMDPWQPDDGLLRHASNSKSAGVATARASYKLQIVIYNVGLAAAKYARIIVSFENISIVKIIRGSRQRIDDLRNGLPTLQFENSNGIIYANSRGCDVIWDLQIKLNKNKWGTIFWEACAEEMELVEGKYVLLGMEQVITGQDIKPYWLPRYEDFLTNFTGGTTAEGNS